MKQIIRICNKNKVLLLAFTGPLFNIIHQRTEVGAVELTLKLFGLNTSHLKPIL